MKKKVLCMGSINIDLVMYAGNLPSLGETVVTDNFQTFPGGKGGNQAVAASKLGADVRYFTKLGDDDFSKELREAQLKYGVNMDYVIIEKGKTAGVAMIMVNNQGQNSILFTPGANALLTPEDVKANESVFDGCDILLITMEIQAETVYEAIRIAKSKNMMVILDPAPAPAEMIPSDITRLVDFVKPNETEAEILTGIPINDRESAERNLEALVKIGFSTPLISLADSGLLTVRNGNKYFINAMKVEAKDSTAAGDIFLGGFTAALANGKSFEESLDFAKTAAAISVTRKGAQSSIPSLREVEEVLNRG